MAVTRTPDLEARRSGTAFISGRNVLEVKRVLESQGYNPGPMRGELAGEMDAQTVQALRRFQDFNNIQQTGILDRATVAHLEQRGANFTGNLDALRRDDGKGPSGYIP
jgi:peptidoglycan hydrolase-like protein with peptidoglycan-binding domain